MTEEERQKLCDKLRVYGKSSFHGGRTCKDAADEIERLMTENSQLKATLIEDYELCRTEVQTMTAQLKQLIAESVERRMRTEQVIEQAMHAADRSGK